MTSEEEEKLVETFLHSGISYWIGLSDIFHEGISKEDISYTRSFSGVYRWQESHQEAQYTNWAPGKPDGDLFDDKDCVWKTFFSDAPGWHDVDCSTSIQEPFGEIHALCEADGITEPTTTTATTEQPGTTTTGDQPTTTTGELTTTFANYCDRVCSGAEEGANKGDCCGPALCICMSSGNFEIDCGANEGFCPEKEECVADCEDCCDVVTTTTVATTSQPGTTGTGDQPDTTTTAQPATTSWASYCDRVCVGLEDYAPAGDRCSNEWCYCSSNGHMDNNCEEGQGFCPASGDCVADCENACQ